MFGPTPNLSQGIEPNIKQRTQNTQQIDYVSRVVEKDDRMHAAVFRSDLQTLVSCNVSVKGEDTMPSRALTTSPHSYSATDYYKVNYYED
jgi:hypothetical protein